MSAGSNVVLEVNDLHVTYHPPDGAAVPAVVGVSLELKTGEIVGLVGESGCGKSSLALAVVGLIRAESGEVRLHGRGITPLRRRRRAEADLGAQMVFQDPTSSLNPRKRASAQLEQALRYATRAGRERKEDVRSLLRKVGLSDARGAAYPHELSGGERQRVAIARSLAASPDVIVADEPLAALDVSLQAQIANLFAAMVETEHVGILLISHDIAAVQQVADRLAVMYLGRFVEVGETTALVTEPAHPYTRALLAAVPDSGNPGNLPEAPTGEVPNPASPPSGCRFHPRCPARLGRCATEAPPTFTLDDGRVVECWLFAETSSPAAAHPTPAIV